MSGTGAKRLDLLLVESGAFPSRTRARAAIEAGLVSVDGRIAEKASQSAPPDARIEVAGDVHPYVSRGALKLVAALDAFAIDPAGKACLDLGASTGGFTEVLLERGASRVYAVDVGAGQLHERLRADPRVVNLEKTHAKDLSPALIGQAPQIVVCDVSFISLRKALPPALALAAPGARLAALVKPQFEVGRAEIGKGGIVRPGRANAEAIAEYILAWIEKEQGWTPIGYRESPIAGGDGNREFLIGAIKTHR